MTMHIPVSLRIARMDPDPILKEGRVKESRSEEDCSCGVTDHDISTYIHHADLFHRLFVFRFGKENLTPYMMKFIDVVPESLKSLPFRSVMRGSTEGKFI